MELPALTDTVGISRQCAGSGEDEERTSPPACSGTSASQHRVPMGSSCDIPHGFSAQH